VQEDAVHVLIAMRVVVSVIVAMMMTMLKAEDTDEVDSQTSNANNQQLPDTLHLTS
jgi:hypothetical protein